MRRSSRLLLAVLGLFCGSALNLAMVVAQSAASSKGISEDVTLSTKDGVDLGATYYPSSLGKQAVPVIMLHDFKESRAVFSTLARDLSAPPEQGYTSYAVLTVDLRGHGDSTRMIGRNGQSRELEAERLKAADYRNMVLRDMEAVRKFLVEKNDAGALNLNKLCVLGSGMGAVVASNYAQYDWSVPQLAQRKQGQDVKALILSSPKWKYNGLSMMQPLKHVDVREKLSFMIVYGEQDPRASKDVRSIHKLLEKFHPEPPRDQRREKQDLFVIPLPTRLQGTKLLTDPNFNMLGRLDAFLDARLMDQDFEWVQRRSSN